MVANIASDIYNKVVKMVVNKLQTTIYIYCNGCERYVGTALYPQTYAWRMDWLRRDCTLVTDIRHELKDMVIQPCLCVKQGKLL